MMADDPFALFETWYAEAREAELNDSNAMTVSSVGADGQPSSRHVSALTDRGSANHDLTRSGGDLRRVLGKDVGSA